ncbi:multicopper oxidase domain-containing protein [Kitasatospora sp. NPDC048540]|uniref:multicopper oxidase domain-containing protein n=1 Tax=Kitasatospora sp. NPDC048540 TaxID=3155634 RepID=UPI0033DEA0FD
MSRRSVLRSGVAVGLTVAADGSAAAGLAAGRAAAAVARGFPQPPVTTPAPAPGAGGRVLEQVLDVRFTDVLVPSHGRLTTRTYNGAIPGPTLRARAGDTLQITHVNGLPPNPPHHGGHNTPHRPDTGITCTT